MEKKCECYEVHKVADVGEDSCGCCMNDHQPVLIPTTDSWEEEFDKIDGSVSSKTQEKYKPFIRSLLKENTTATLRQGTDKLWQDFAEHDWGLLSTHRDVIISHIDAVLSEQHKLTSE